MNEILCFHNPDEENGYLSNWYPSDFNVEGVQYSSMGQYMMYQKAVVFSDKETAGKILDIQDTAKIKALGRQVRGYEDTIWSGIRQIMVFEGLYWKFLQNPKLRGKLLLTGSSILAECSVKDAVWGIGLSMADSRRHDMSAWKGRNLLGFSLMMVRDIF